MKNHKEKKGRKSKEKSSLLVVELKDIFIRIITIDSAFKIYNIMKDEYEGDDRIK